MKSKSRNIQVNCEHFVYRCGNMRRDFVSTGYTLDISPKNNRRCRVKVSFPAQEPENKTHNFWGFYEVEAESNGKSELIAIALPRFIANVITYLIKVEPTIFSSNKMIIKDGWKVLSGLGYSESKPLWKEEW